MDSLVFEESITSDAQESEFLAKKWAYVNDNNSGNYSNQVVIDTTALCNSGQYVGWNEGYILMPLVVQLTADTAANLPISSTSDNIFAGDQTWAFKNGFWQMLHSMSVEFNNGGVVGLYPFLNVFASFKAQTSFSDADVFNHGDGIGFFMDTADSWSYQDLTEPSDYNTYSVLSVGDGAGLCNNKNFPPTSLNTISMAATTGFGLSNQFITPAQATFNCGTDNIGYSYNSTAQAIRTSGKPYPAGDTLYNEGMRKRQIAVNRNTQSDLNLASEFTTGYLGQEKLMPISSLNDVWATHQLQSTTAGVRGWNIYAKLRLKDLADFFHKVPLLKGATLRFIMNTNQAITSFQTTNPVMATSTAVGATTLAVSSGTPVASALIAATRVNIVGGMTNPLMLASNALLQGSSALFNGAYKLSVSIVKCNFTEQSLYSGLCNTALQSCRLYAPLYTFTPAAERRYLSLKTKTITYKDVMSYQFTAIPSQSNFNILVSQGLKNICSVLVVPLLASTANGPLCMTAEVTGLPNFNTTVTHPSTLMSPFCTTGATPDPVIFNNFNVLIQGVPCFLMDEMYDFEAFKHQLMSSNQLNGNLTTGLTSGLISERMFSYLYRYYYADCYRKLPAERDTDRSIQVRGRNLCTTAVDLLVFIEVEKTIVVDLETGARVA